MFELIQVGEKTYYIESFTKIGVYLTSDTDAYLVDSGENDTVARKLLQILGERGWRLRGILNTHSHVDHIGGNRLLQRETGCPVYCHASDISFVEHPELTPAFFYGGYPFAELRGHFFSVGGSRATELTADELPPGLEVTSLDGHSFSILGFRTDDGVWFLSDCLMSERSLARLHVSFVYDVAAYLATLEKVKTLDGALFVPSHAAPTRDIAPLAEANARKVREIAGRLAEICAAPTSTEDAVAALIDAYGLRMSHIQHPFMSITIRSYLAYLRDRGDLTVALEGGRLLWERAPRGALR